MSDSDMNSSTMPANDSAAQTKQTVENENQPTALSSDNEPTFAELGVPNTIVKGLARDGKTNAFPIQAETLPDSLQGCDILGRGATGSGKTLAYAIPLLARLTGRRSERNFPRGLVLAPTRELANQINDVLKPLASDCNLTTTTIYGGVRQSRQTRDLNRGVDIVVACPGRLKDLIDQGKLTLGEVEVTVLDEADEMADMGFLPDVTELLEMTPEGTQRMLFSATLDHGVDKLVRRFLNDPKVHEIDSATAQVSTMTQHVFQVVPAQKGKVVKALASGTGKRILFTRTKMEAEELAAELIEDGIPAAELHGNLSQSQRDRNLRAFSSDEVRVMVATDVAARGMDISGVELVAQIDPPMDSKSFLHRSGRTARAGQSGDVVTLVTPKQKRRTLQMLRHAGIKGQVVKVDEDSQELQELIGETAPIIEGWSIEKYSKRPSSRQRHSDRGFERHSGGHRSGSGRSDRRSFDRSAEPGKKYGRRDRDFDRDHRSFNRHEHYSENIVADNEDWSKPFDGRSQQHRDHDGYSNQHRSNHYDRSDRRSDGRGNDRPRYGSDNRHDGGYRGRNAESDRRNQRHDSDRSFRDGDSSYAQSHSDGNYRGRGTRGGYGKHSGQHDGYQSRNRHSNGNRGRNRY